jgi:hypothetical protein
LPKEGRDIVSTKSRKLITTLIIVASVLLTPAAVKQAYTMRGYWAFGGEWFLIPLGLLIAQFWKDVASTMTEEMDKKNRPLPLQQVRGQAKDLRILYHF